MTAKSTQQQDQAFSFRKGLVVGLDQVELFEVVSQDGVFYSCEDQADVLGVGGAGEVRVDGFVFVFVLLLVHLKNKFLCCLWIIFGA